MELEEREELIATIFRALRAQGFDKASSYEVAAAFADACEKDEIVTLEIAPRIWTPQDEQEWESK